MGVLLIFGILLTFSNLNNALNTFNFANELPCDIEDSIDITNGTIQPNDTILYHGTFYSKDDAVQVNYILINGTKHKTIESHLRGCPCKVRPCIRLCCPLGSFVDPNKLKIGSILQRIPCYSHESATNYEHEVIQQNNETSVRQLVEMFSFVVLQTPVKYFRPKNFQITHTGEILDSNKTRNHHDYCLRADINKSTNQIQFDVLVYYNHTDETQPRHITSASCMVVSVLFILATIIVYLVLPELHNLHGSCMVCHLAGLVVAYTVAAWLKFEGHNYVNPIVCMISGFLAYFSLISAFLWLNVISYDLWRNFRATHRLRQCCDRKKIRYYMLYAWGIPLLLTLLMWILGHSNWLTLPNSYLPGVQEKTCFLRRDSTWLYYYTPIIIIFTANFIYFTSTTLKIYQIQRDLIKMTSQEESARHQTNLNNGKDDLTLYIRLFIIAGITWIMEGLSIVAPNSWFFRFFDFFNASQGLIIFISYIMKRRVFKLLQKRYRDVSKKNSARESFSLNSSLNKSTHLGLSVSSCEKTKYKEFR